MCQRTLFSQGDGPGGEQRSLRRWPDDAGGGRGSGRGRTQEGGQTTATGHTGVLAQWVLAASLTWGRRPRHTWGTSGMRAGRWGSRTCPLSLEVKAPWGAPLRSPRQRPVGLSRLPPFSTDGVHVHISVAVCFATMCTHKMLAETALYIKDNSLLSFISLTDPKPEITAPGSTDHPPNPHPRTDRRHQGIGLKVYM